MCHKSLLLPIKVKVLLAQSRLTLCNSKDYSPSNSSVHGIFQVRIPEWAAIPFSRGSSQPRDQTRVSCICRQILCCLGHHGVLLAPYSDFIVFVFHMRIALLENFITLASVKLYK